MFSAIVTRIDHQSEKHFPSSKDNSELDYDHLSIKNALSQTRSLIAFYISIRKGNRLANSRYYHFCLQIR